MPGVRAEITGDDPASGGIGSIIYCPNFIFSVPSNPENAFRPVKGTAQLGKEKMLVLSAFSATFSCLNKHGVVHFYLK
jgi:hypothetical protein